MRCYIFALLLTLPDFSTFSLCHSVLTIIINIDVNTIDKTAKNTNGRMIAFAILILFFIVFLFYKICLACNEALNSGFVLNG